MIFSQRPPKLSPKSPEPQETSYYDESECVGDLDEDMSGQMTASYSEISFRSEPDNDIASAILSEGIPVIDKMRVRPVTLPYEVTKPKGHLGPLNLEGTVHVEGNMMHFVAEDLEYKIKLSSPNTKKGGTNNYNKVTRINSKVTFEN